MGINLLELIRHMIHEFPLVKTINDTSLVPPGALAHRLECLTVCNAADGAAFKEIVTTDIIAR